MLCLSFGGMTDAKSATPAQSSIIRTRAQLLGNMPRPRKPDDYETRHVNRPIGTITTLAKNINR
jgi:hypothetical protein